jgi:hypothetical protein
MDERLKTLKPGDAIRLKTQIDERDVCRFVMLVGSDVMVYWDAKSPSRSGSLFMTTADNIVTPEAPKAKPGVVYQDGNGVQRIGTADGRLWSMAFNQPTVVDFTSEWIEADTMLAVYRSWLRQ